MFEIKFLQNNFIKNDPNTFSFISNDENKIFDISNEDAKNFHDNLDHINWQKLAYDMFYEKNPWLYEIITDSNRSDFLFLFDIDKNALALDVGAGWGQVSIPLSQHCNVVALEKNLEKINIIKKIAKQEKCNNLQYVVGNFSEDIFENNQFDLIILNGVFEWLGEFSTDLDTLNLHKKILKKIFSLLKPNGILYIGIENQYGLKYLLGESDDHTGLNDFVYLDHKLQSLIYKSFKKNDLHVFTYSKKNYETMLNDVGFQSIEFFGALPDYKRIKSLISLSTTYPTHFQQKYLEFIPEFDGYNGKSSQMNEKLKKLYPIISAEQLINFYPSYSIVARKNSN